MCIRSMIKGRHTKLLDDKRARVRQGQQELSHTHHATRKYYDDEKSKADMLISVSTNQQATEASNTY